MRNISWSRGLAGFVCLVALTGPTFAQDNGTGLTMTLIASEPVCLGTEEKGTVTIAGVLTTTGSVDSAILTRQIDAFDPVEIGTINPRDWTHMGGRDKSATYSDTLTLPNGTYTLTYCFTQSGAQGREPKQVCASTSITIACEVAPACDEGFFGDITSNRVLGCRQSPKHDSPMIPVHLKTGSPAPIELTISGPDFLSVVTMAHSGESCVYHYPCENDKNGCGNAGFKITTAGSYTLTARDANGAIIATLTRWLGCNP